MNKTDFVPKFLEFCKSGGFSFLCPDEQFAEPKKMADGKQTLIAAGAAAAFAAVFGGGAVVGAIVGSNAGYSGHSKEELIADLKSMNQYCDLVGINVSNGACVLRLVIDADEIPYETLVGRFALIHERAHTFRKYAMVIMKNWIWGDTTAGTTAQGVVHFSSHKRAKDFVQLYADKCRHRAMRKAIYTYPFIVDLEDEEPTILSFRLFKVKTEEFKAAIFKKRML